MSPARFIAWILTIFSLPALSISDRCSGDSVLHSFKDNSERCCQNVTVPPGHERRICKEENGKAEYGKCPSDTYQNTNYPSVMAIYCKQHSVCSKPNMVVDVPGNSTSNTLCKCNEAEGYKAKNVAVGTTTLEIYQCLLDRSAKGTSNITSTATESPSDTTESPSKTTETAETVSHSVSKITVDVTAIVAIVAIIAVIVLITIVFFAAFIVKKRRRNNSACQQFKRNQGGPNGAQTSVNIMDGENCPLDICTDGHEEGDAVGNGHVTNNRTCLLSTLSPDGLSENDERRNAVGNGHVTSNGACSHITPLSPGLSETDELNIVELREETEDVYSSLCAQSNSTEFQNKKNWIDKRYIS